MAESELTKENELKVAMRVKDIAERLGVGLEKETVYLGDVPKDEKKQSGKEGSKQSGKTEKDSAEKDVSSEKNEKENVKKGSVNKFLKKVPERGEFKKKEFIFIDRFKIIGRFT